jgi:glycerol-3-phosphate dehydrogenase (NAD(P)+)
MNVTVLGAGSWGTTLALVLHENQHKVMLWTFWEDQAKQMIETRENPQFLPGIRLPDDLEISSDLKLVCAGKDMIVAAVPSQFLRSSIEKIADLDLTKTIICNVAKGIEKDSGMTMSQVLLDVLKHEQKGNIAILSGPSHAEEVSIKQPTAIVASAFNLKIAKIVQKAFMTSYFRVYVNGDLRGVELGGALKNVIAIAAGISDGAGYGDNTKAAIMTRGIYEITRLGVAMGARSSTFAGLSGIGDLIVTCMSHHSRNRYVGQEVGKGRKLDDVLKEMVMVAEGVVNTKSAMQLAERYKLDLPIISEVYNVLFEDKNPRLAMEDLMLRQSKKE